MKKEKIDEIVGEMKSGELKLDKKKDADTYLIQSVEVE